jgi:hypothetical protein
MPILYASRERDEGGEVTWQFHCVTVPFDTKDAQLVRLDTILRIDPTIAELHDLPVGMAASRSAAAQPWSRHQETE